jgi:hypothetical protein
MPVPPKDTSLRAVMPDSADAPASVTCLHLFRFRACRPLSRASASTPPSLMLVHPLRSSLKQECCRGTSQHAY